MKIIFAGTPKFASEHLSILLGGEHEIVAVLTQPDRKSGRGKKISFSEVKEIALENDLKVLQPASLKDVEIQKSINNLKPDIILVVAYGLLIPKTVLDIPKLGCINIHASLLPRWRGASPIESCIAAGDSESGITMMKMSEGLDEGPILKKFVCHLDEKETLETLEKKFIGMSSENLLQFLKDYENKKISEVIQPTTGSTYANKIDNTFKRINWAGQTAGEIENTIKKNNSSVEPGLILINKEGSLEVGCKDSSLLEIETLQMPGKRIISSKEFVRGYKSTLSKNLKFS